MISKAVEKHHDAIRELDNRARAKRIEFKKARKKTPKKLDTRSYKHAVQNAGIPVTGASAYAGFQLYKELKAWLRHRRHCGGPLRSFRIWRRW